MILDPVLNISSGNAIKLPNGDKRKALPALPIYASLGTRLRRLAANSSKKSSKLPIYSPPQDQNFF